MVYVCRDNRAFYFYILEASLPKYGDNYVAITFFIFPNTLYLISFNF